MMRKDPDNDFYIVKSELVEAIAQKFPGIAPGDVETAVRSILDQMTDAIADGVRIEIRGFGSFSLHHLPARIGRNPKTGELVVVNARRSTHFKPGKDLRMKVDCSNN